MVYNPVKVMVFGSFDIIHKGHEFFFNEARKYGDILIVSVARDKTIKKIKHHEPKFDENTRLRDVQKYADKAVLGYEKDKLKIIEDMDPDVICLGHDQVNFTDNLKAELKKRGLNPKIIRLPSYKRHKYSSTKIRAKEQNEI